MARTKVADADLRAYLDAPSRRAPFRALPIDIGLAFAGALYVAM